MVLVMFRLIRCRVDSSIELLLVCSSCELMVNIVVGLVWCVMVCMFMVGRLEVCLKKGSMLCLVII